MRDRVRIGNLEEEVRSLTVAVSTLIVDRDYYRSQRDRWKQEAADAKQALRQIVVAVESNQTERERLDAILRIARTNSGA